jgi:hypothetical protein
MCFWFILKTASIASSSIGALVVTSLFQPFLKTIQLHIFFSILLKIIQHDFSKTTSTLKIRQLTLSPLFIYAFQFVPLTNATS